jgi:hypothetical protein
MDMDITPAPDVERGCGRRKPGGLYLCTNSGPVGVDLDSFLICPTHPLPPELLASVSRLGVHPIELEGGHTAIIDWIGTSHYPTFPHFWTEGRVFGLSRRISPDPALLARLTPNSLLVYVHACGHLQNANEFHRRRAIAACAKDLKEHQAPPEGLTDTCISLLWETQGPATNPDRRVLVPLACGESFRAWTCPPEVEPVWEPAVCAVIPMTYFHLEVVQEAGGAHKAVAETATAATSMQVVEVIA